MKKYFLFDCETGGTNPKMSLLTLYGMVLDQELNPTDSISLKIKPNNGRYLVEARAMEINGINLIEHNKNAIPLKEAASQFYDFIFKHIGQDKMIAAGHNLSLDIRFVKQHLLRDSEHPEGNSWGKFFSHRRLDSASNTQFLILAGKLPQDLDGSLASLARHFNIPFEKAHNAEEDTKITLEVLKRQIALIK